MFCEWDTSKHLFCGDAVMKKKMKYNVHLFKTDTYIYESAWAADLGRSGRS